jgi:GWxTD domain-containing protein
LIREKAAAIFSIFCLFFLFCHQGLGQQPSKPTQPGREPLSDASRQWLEEVVPYIITSAEKEIFLTLRTEEERGKFIENFWKKRDPNPRTAENEFKLDYYRRIALANKFFGEGGIDGWRTERGKICILLGPPNEIQRDMSASDNSLSIFRGPKEIWNYWGLSNPGLPYNLEFVFIDRTGTGHYVLEKSLSLAEPGGNPFDIDSLQHHFDYLEYMAQAMRNPFEDLDKLREIITTQVSYDLIPLQPEFLYLKGPEGKTHVPLIVSLPRSSITGKKTEEQYQYSLTLLINISDNLGRLAFEKSKDFNFKSAPGEILAWKERPLDLQYSMDLEPAAYRLHLLVLDNCSGKIGTFHEEISIPDFSGGEFNLSDIILSSEIGKELAAEKAEEEKRGLSEERELLRLSRSFRPDDELNVEFEIYNLSLNPQTGLNSFQVEYLFFQKETLLVHIPASKTEATEEKDCRVRTSFKLKNFKPGQYILRAKIYDVHSGKTASRDAHFRVI